MISKIKKKKTEKKLELKPVNFYNEKEEIILGLNKKEITNLKQNNFYKVSINKSSLCNEITNKEIILDDIDDDKNDKKLNKNFLKITSYKWGSSNNSFRKSSFFKSKSLVEDDYVLEEPEKLEELNQAFLILDNFNQEGKNFGEKNNELIDKKLNMEGLKKDYLKKTTINYRLKTNVSNTRKNNLKDVSSILNLNEIEKIDTKKKIIFNSENLKKKQYLLGRKYNKMQTINKNNILEVENFNKTLIINNNMILEEKYNQERTSLKKNNISYHKNIINNNIILEEKQNQKRPTLMKNQISDEKYNQKRPTLMKNQISEEKYNQKRPTLIKNQIYEEKYNEKRPTLIKNQYPEEKYNQKRPTLIKNQYSDEKYNQQKQRPTLNKTLAYQLKGQKYFLDNKDRQSTKNIKSRLKKNCSFFGNVDQENKIDLKSDFENDDTKNHIKSKLCIKNSFFENIDENPEKVTKFDLEIKSSFEENEEEIKEEDENLIKKKIKSKLKKNSSVYYTIVQIKTQKKIASFKNMKNPMVFKNGKYNLKIDLNQNIAILNQIKGDLKNMKNYKKKKNKKFFQKNIFIECDLILEDNLKTVYNLKFFKIKNYISFIELNGEKILKDETKNFNHLFSVLKNKNLKRTKYVNKKNSTKMIIVHNRKLFYFKFPIEIVKKNSKKKKFFKELIGRIKFKNKKHEKGYIALISNLYKKEIENDKIFCLSHFIKFDCFLSFNYAKAEININSKKFCLSKVQNDY